MSVDRKEIDLIIRAAIQGGKTLDSVTKSIADIEKALDSQADAAKRGEASIDELKSTLMALKQVQDQLKDQAGLVGQFQRLGEQIAKQEEKVAKAAKAHADYKDKLDKAGKATDFQANKLVKLATAAERNESTLAKQRTDQEALGAALREAGIEIGKLAEAENTARQSAAMLGITINKAQEAIANYASNVRQARVENAKLADDATFQKKLEEAAKLNKAGEYVRFWENSLRDADIAEQQLTISNALRKTADEALAAARGYRTLGTAAKTLGEGNGLRDMITGIVNPGEESRRTLAGIEAEISKIGNAARAAKGPIADYKGQLNALFAANKAIGDKAGLAESFYRQLAVMKQAGAEFSTARVKVVELANALRNSTGANDELRLSLSAAQATLQAAEKNLASQLSTYRNLRDAMRQAGLSTADFVALQARLVAAAKDSTHAVELLRQAKQKFGDATDTATKKFSLFRDEGRTTLSLYQRIRGEVLSMAAAYVGLYGAIDAVRKVTEAYNGRQETQNKLAVVVGDDTKKIGEAYDYVRGQADRLGLDLGRASAGYASFAANAKLAGREIKETNYIFESFSEVGTTLGLGAEKMDRVFYALGQMMNKGKIQAEELSGQLGDVLPGAFGTFQKALKDKFPDLKKAMEDGKVSVSNLVSVAEEYRKMVADRLPKATESFVAQQNRFNTAMFDFKLAIADSGFIDQLTETIKRLTDVMKSSDGKKFAKDIGDGFGAIAKFVALLAENIETVKTILELAFGIIAVKKLSSFGAGLITMAGSLGIATGAAKTLATTLGIVNKTFGVLAAAFVGWEIGTILYQQSSYAKAWGAGMVYLFETVWTAITYGVKIAWAEIPAVVTSGLALLGNILTSGFRQMLGLFSTTAKFLGKDELGASIDKVIASIEFKVDRIGNASATLRKQMVADLATIKKISREMVNDAFATPGSSTGKPVAGTTAKPTPGEDKANVDKEAAEKRLKIKESLESELRSIEARVEKSEKDSLERRIAAIDIASQTLLNKIKAFGGKDAADLEARYVRATNELKMAEIVKFNNELEKEQEGIQKKLEQIDAQAGKKTKDDLNLRLKGVRDSYEQTYRDIAAFRETLAANGRDTAPADEQKRRLDSGVLALQQLEQQKYYEDSINLLLGERKAKLDAINAQKEAGLVTETEANRLGTIAVEEMQPKIQAVADEALRYADAMMQAGVAIGQDITALETLRAKMIAAADSGKGLTAQSQMTQKIIQNLADGGTNAFMGMAEAVTKSALGFQSWKDGIAQVRRSFLQFAADFLQQIAQMIIKQMLLNALQKAGGGGGVIGTIASLFASVKHTGGVVGASGGSSRRVSEALFAGAPRYHGGGIAGLAPDEYPTILKKNEEVLTTADPRNVLNGGTSQGKPQDISLVNYVDAQSFLSAAAATPSGRKVIMNVLSAERSQLRAIVGVK